MFLFLYFMLFSFTKLENGRAEQALRSKGLGEDWHWWEGGVGEERDRRMNTVQIIYTYVYKYKNDAPWNCSSNQARGCKREEEQMNSSTIHLTHCKNLCKCYNVCTIQHNNIKSLFLNILVFWGYFPVFFSVCLLLVYRNAVDFCKSGLGGIFRIF
jgi:hypothetical protein